MTTASPRLGSTLSTPITDAIAVKDKRCSLETLQTLEKLERDRARILQALKNLKAAVNPKPGVFSTNCEAEVVDTALLLRELGEL